MRKSTRPPSPSSAPRKRSRSRTRASSCRITRPSWRARKSGPVGLLFLGDSITERWKVAPHIWDAYYSKYQPANFGIGGARTQNLIWQIEHGELDGIAPKVTVLMLGHE
jgi:hypothetical protein